MTAETDWIDLAGRLGLNYDPKSVSAEFIPILAHVRSAIGNGNYWQVSEDELFDLYCLCRISGAKVVIETGVGPGTSSYSILSAISRNNGRLHSIDLGEKYGEDSEMPVGFVVPDSFRKFWNLNIGSSRNLLGKVLEVAGRPDVFFHDSEHTYENVMFELEMVFPRLGKDSFIVVDNYDWTEAPRDFAEKNRLKLNRTHDDMCIISR